MRREILTVKDGKAINLAVWDGVERPRGVVQISHGMAEHIARYDDFARYLNGRGYIVAGDDHRAHGLTDAGALGQRGASENLFEATAADLREITRYLKRYALPVVLFGHSYGSFLTQRYLTTDTSEICAAVLCGSALQRGAALNFGHALAKKKNRRKADKPAKLIAHLTFEAYDKKFEDGINGWLSRNSTAVGKYNTDPLCNFVCSYGFYYDFFAGLKRLNCLPVTLDKTKPVMIVSGSDDMVGGRGKSVKRLRDKFKNLGYDVTFRLYTGARHEILNETNRAEVYDDLAAFFDKATAQ